MSIISLILLFSVHAQAQEMDYAPEEECSAGFMQRGDECIPIGEESMMGPYLPSTSSTNNGNTRQAATDACTESLSAIRTLAQNTSNSSTSASIIHREFQSSVSTKITKYTQLIATRLSQPTSQTFKNAKNFAAEVVSDIDSFLSTKKNKMDQNIQVCFSTSSQLRQLVGRLACSNSTIDSLLRSTEKAEELCHNIHDHYIREKPEELKKRYSALANAAQQNYLAQAATEESGSAVSAERQTREVTSTAPTPPATPAATSLTFGRQAGTGASREQRYVSASMAPATPPSGRNVNAEPGGGTGGSGGGGSTVAPSAPAPAGESASSASAPSSSAAESSYGSSADANDDSSYDNDEGEQEPRRKGPNQQQRNTLAGAAMSLLTTFMTNKGPQKIDPVQLDAGDCRRPENMYSQTCRCQRSWTPDCSGTASNTSPFKTNSLPSVGGAALKKGSAAGSASTKLSLDPEAQFLPQGGRGNGGDAGGPPPMGGYSGGGGLNTAPGKFIPDENKGRGGPSISANILSGTYSGNPMNRGGARPLAYRPSGGRGSYNGPEDLPGYQLNNQQPDLRQFLPAGQTKPQAHDGSVQRNISGMGDGGSPKGSMHPATANLFREVSQRYRKIEASLYP